ncbi:hypothetical protein AB670_03603 [Chryseobacterium sp. MOF25P]|nr:hypothetical protein AB670_03603 [Chryseobacterium sp. MOF25P]OBW45908.1 hypothetical protein AB671_02025 [Chryseobacterium sp. BGARF1]
MKYLNLLTSKFSIIENGVDVRVDSDIFTIITI